MKKRTIALERDAKVFGGDVVAAIPLVFEFGAFLGENLGQTLHGRRDESVRLLDRTTRLVDEGGLNALPAVSQVFKLVVREKRCAATRIVDIGSGFLRGDRRCNLRRNRCRS
jgi:hypothetical protein